VRGINFWSQDSAQDSGSPLRTGKGVQAKYAHCGWPREPLILFSIPYRELPLAARGINVDMDHLAETTMDDVSAMLADPFPWAQRWLAEFRDDPKDNYMVALFADHCVKQYNAFKQAIESTRPK
jgi:hypothetical protein